jgi:uncharacterized protein (DUF2249 family)
MSVEATDDGMYELDAREIDGEPFNDIMFALESFNKDETLVLINNFEPELLYNVLEQRGFTYERIQRVDDERHVSITRLTEHVRNNTFTANHSIRIRMSDQTLDLRDIPPADRHPKIHDAFAELESGEALTLINDHEPKPLFYEMQAEVKEFDDERSEVE